MSSRLFKFLLNYVNNKYLMGFILYLINLCFKRFKNLSCYQVVWLDNLSSEVVIKLREEFETFVYPPSYKQKQAKLSVVAPEVILYKFNNALVTAGSSNIIVENKVIIERMQNIDDSNANYSNDFVKEHDNDRAIVVPNVKEELNTVFFLGGNGSWNYYHWIIEIVPKIQYYIEAGLAKKKISLLVSEQVLKTPSFLEILKKCLLAYDVEIIFMSEFKVYKVQNLYHINAPNNIVFNTRHVLSRPDFCYYRKESLEYVRKIGASILLDWQNNNVAKSELVSYDRIILARKKTAYRKFNQEEVIELLSTYGFRTVFMEDYSLAEQIHIFNMAKIIIGPSGAAWTNLVFAKPGLKAISWIPEIVKFFSAYSTLANLNDSSMEFLLTSSKDSKDYHGDYHLELDILEKKLISLLDS